MDDPLYVVRHTAARWLTTTNHELFIWETRFASIRGLTLKSGRNDARIERAVYGKLSWRETRTRTQAWADERIAHALELSEDELLAQAPDNMIFDTSAITAARLSKHFGMCKLTVTLDDGRRLKWRWMNSRQCGRYEEVAPVLRRTLGSRVVAR
jgi:hypothetical protein